MTIPNKKEEKEYIDGFDGNYFVYINISYLTAMNHNIFGVMNYWIFIRVGTFTRTFSISDQKVSSPTLIFILFIVIVDITR